MSRLATVRPCPPGPLVRRAVGATRATTNGRGAAPGARRPARPSGKAADRPARSQRRPACPLRRRRPEPRRAPVAPAGRRPDRAPAPPARPAGAGAAPPQVAHPARQQAASAPVERASRPSSAAGERAPGLGQRGPSGRPGRPHPGGPEAPGAGSAPRARPPKRSKDRWIDEGPVAEAAPAAGARSGPGRGRSGRRPPLPADVAADLARAGSSGRAAEWGAQLQEAAAAYDAERFADARRLLEPLASAAPGRGRRPRAPRPRRLPPGALAPGRHRARGGRGARPTPSSSTRCWPMPTAPSGTPTPWNACGTSSAGAAWASRCSPRAGSSPPASRADGGDLRGAIALLEAGPVDVRRPREHHLRLWYALAALYERAGDVPRSRALLRRLVAEDPGFADAASRLAGSGLDGRRHERHGDHQARTAAARRPGRAGPARPTGSSRSSPTGYSPGCCTPLKSPNGHRSGRTPPWR